MTATDELRKLLDERGVEHVDATPGTLPGVTNWVTEAWLSDGRWFRAIETQRRDFTIELFRYTPEMAIAATLGSERERELELLVKQLWYLVNHRSRYGYAAALESIEELGIEVER